MKAVTNLFGITALALASTACDKGQPALESSNALWKIEADSNKDWHIEDSSGHLYESAGDINKYYSRSSIEFTQKGTLTHTIISGPSIAKSAAHISQALMSPVTTDKDWRVTDFKGNIYQSFGNITLKADQEDITFVDRASGSIISVTGPSSAIICDNCPIPASKTAHLKNK